MGDRDLIVDNDRPLRVEGSPDELHRMVLNLLDNAARHTPPGARSSSSLREEDGDAVVEVADDGPGIPAAMREQVFDRFVRGEGPADTAARHRHRPRPGDRQRRRRLPRRQRRSRANRDPAAPSSAPASRSPRLRAKLVSGPLEAL